MLFVTRTYFSQKHTFIFATSPRGDDKEQFVGNADAACLLVPLVQGWREGGGGQTFVIIKKLLLGVTITSLGNNANFNAYSSEKGAVVPTSSSKRAYCCIRWILTFHCERLWKTWKPRLFLQCLIRSRRFVNVYHGVRPVKFIGGKNKGNNVVLRSPFHCGHLLLKRGVMWRTVGMDSRQLKTLSTNCRSRRQRVRNWLAWRWPPDCRWDGSSSLSRQAT
jgi:hypothetical protein